MAKLSGRILGTAALLLLLTGCVAIPPLVQVSHKEEPATKSRLDSIEDRLKRIEQKLDQSVK